MTQIAFVTLHSFRDLLTSLDQLFPRTIEQDILQMIERGVIVARKFSHQLR
jgi:hypothetical protein